jgi:hypothetical protein
MNGEYEVSRYAPGLFLIGSDGGGEAFAFDLRDARSERVVSVPFVGMDIASIRILGDDFSAFLDRLYDES